MRIQQVRFKNLNSLAGEWEIDLTKPAFTSDGIFAITGPTGAGKTTILDAICLALYGRTPRLTKVTKSGNEIMSRQTGECFAEVTFETQTGRYRCHWSQHRSRRKPDGELQSPKHEIANADSGQIFESKLRGVGEQIETVTGMDFDRFTRSMLLAQGGFAAFLQAAPDERAPILEQITGTEIYSKISIRVHETRSGERKKLDLLLAELAGMQLLSEEDERHLKGRLEEKTGLDTELSQRVAQTHHAIAWLEGIARLEQELLLVTEEKQQWQLRQLSFAPEQERLQRAIHGLELSGDYAGLTALRRVQETDTAVHGECLELLPIHTELVKNAQATVELAGEQLAARKREQHDASLIIRNVRELDLKIQEKDKPLMSAAEVISASEKALAALRLKQEHDVASLESNRKTLEGLFEHLAVTGADGALVENLTGIQARIDGVITLNRQHTLKREEVATAGRQVMETTHIWSGLTEKLTALKSGFELSKHACAEQQRLLATTLEDQELPEWRSRMSSLTESMTRLDTVREAARLCADMRSSLLLFGTQHEELVAQHATLTEQLLTHNEQSAALEREVSLLETQLSLLTKIQSYQKARHHLQDGECCPLCGALEHPFAEGNIPVADETTALLLKARAVLKGVNEKIAQQRILLAERTKDREQLITKQQACVESLAVSGAVINQQCEFLNIDGAAPDLFDVVWHLRQEREDTLNHVANIVRSAETLEKELAVLREALEKTRDSVVLAEQHAHTATHNKDSALQQRERVTQEAEALEAQRINLLAALQQELAGYGINSLSSDLLEQIRAELICRRDTWLAKQEEKRGLEQQITVGELQTLHQAEQMNQTVMEVTRQQALYSVLQGEQAALRSERQELFGDRNPDAEETLLSAARDTAEKSLETSRLTLNRVTQERGNLQQRIEALHTALTDRSPLVHTAEASFRTRLDGFGFADELCYLAACLPENERTALAQQAQKLSDEHIELSSRHREKTRLLETEKLRNVTDQSRTDLTQALAILITDQKELQLEIGGIHQKLSDNSNLKQQCQERAEAIDAQKRECSRWDLLHELIGSADGKKFRNFAQGLTFEMMVGHANRQLQKMTDRYLLIRDIGQPLELNVVDNYQAGEIRSTKNLSGGESFIVSLSLALGLSHMASKNVRVDSLFLDEGFGTLDEEALDTAIETLAGLQQDGKLIGIISHVSALKERISTQIQVTPHTGGRSSIAGPGCRRV